MSPFNAAIFVLGLSLANAINFTTVYEWEKFEFIWPSGLNSTVIEEMKQNVNPKNVNLRYMAVFGERLFLSYQTISGIPASLVWLPTSATSTAPPLALFPSWDFYKNENCNTVEWARGMKTDTDGRLWVLDQGTEICPGKLWIFDLLNNDTTERVHQFPDKIVSHSYLERFLHDLVLDKTPDDTLAYIVDSESEHVVVYSRKLDKSWPVKTPGTRWSSLALSANTEARQLYLKSYDSTELYSVSVSELKNQGGNATAKFIGEFTDHPYTILIDSANVLYAAFYGQSYVSKWNISEPLREQQQIYGDGILGAIQPFTFALDTNGNLWMTERNQTASGIGHKLLKAAVGARSSTDLSLRG